MNDFYTYAYLREDKTPYYIGKGSQNRIYSTNKRVKPPKDKSRIIFLKQNLTEEEAFKHEIYMIAVFGRKDLGTGILRNLTDGGEGISNPSEETKKKQSEGIKKQLASLTPEQRSERTRKALSEITKEQWREIALKREAKRLPEERSEAVRKGRANMTPEQRSQIAKKGRSNMTPEQKSEIGKKINSGLTLEQKRKNAEKAREAYFGGTTPEQRSERARQRQLNKSPEQMKKERKKAIETYFSRTTPEQRSERWRKSISQRWQCTETGYVNSAASLSHYQKKRGIDKSKRVRLDQ